jgi:hypothetical protein
MVSGSYVIPTVVTRNRTDFEKAGVPIVVRHADETDSDVRNTPRLAHQSMSGFRLRFNFNDIGICLPGDSAIAGISV